MKKSASVEETQLNIIISDVEKHFFNRESAKSKILWYPFLKLKSQK